MSTLRKFTSRHRKVLAAVARGHPERTLPPGLYHVDRGTALDPAVNAMEWSEIAIAAGFAYDETLDCLVALKRKHLIDHACLRPGLLGRLVGKEQKYFSWVTDAGRRYLAEHPDEDFPEELVLPSMLTATPEDLSEAISVYENSIGPRSYYPPGMVRTAPLLLDEDIKEEIRKAVKELEEMWGAFEARFGHRSAARSKVEAALRDPAVRRHGARIARANREQLRRRGFEASPYSEEQRKNIDELDPAPWDPPFE